MSDVLRQIIAQMQASGQQQNPTIGTLNRVSPVPASIRPPDPERGYADQFNTPLTPDQETAYQAWGKQQAAARPDHRNPALDTYDYDMRGAWLNNAQAAANGHLPDTWKKPNEPTFSTQSKYSTTQNPGGAWAQQADGTWTFTPSQFNLKMNSAEDLQKSWAREQPGAKLALPTASVPANGMNAATTHLKLSDTPPDDDWADSVPPPGGTSRISTTNFMPQSVSDVAPSPAQTTSKRP